VRENDGEGVLRGPLPRASTAFCPRAAAVPEARELHRRRILGMTDSYSFPLSLFAAVVLIATGLAAPARADDAATPPPARVAMVIPDPDETDIADCLEMAVDAANKENFDGFLECFATSTRSAVRRQMALFFVQHDVAIDLVDKQLVTRERDRAELAVNYTTSLTGQEYDIVSFLQLVRDDKRWVIRNESIVSRTVRRSSGSSSPCGPGGCPPAPCFGGQCGVPGAGFQIQFP
jgi:hypothetical protein